jgi:hypothetical protein
MFDSTGRLSHEVRSLLASERSIPAQSSIVRARVLANARGALAVENSAPAAPKGAPRRVGLAALVLAGVVSAAVAAAAYQAGARLNPSTPEAGLSKPSPRW